MIADWIERQFHDHPALFIVGLLLFEGVFLGLLGTFTGKGH